MQARSGDWLVVHSHSDGGHVRKAEIIATHGGEPPYTVRWLDEDKESIVFPGPDAQVVPAAEMAELNEAAATRIGRVQTAINGGHVAG
ncbi:DUF1918 domain-containing protein [Nakamurella sp. GG22]